MSTSKNPLTKIGGTEVVVGINTVGIVFLYYKFQEMGTDLNNKILKLANIIKTLNRNTNIVNMHLRSHLIKHKTELDIDEDITEEDILLNIDNKKMFETFSTEIRKLEERIALLESTRNPIV